MSSCKVYSHRLMDDILQAGRSEVSSNGNNNASRIPRDVAKPGTQNRTPRSFEEQLEAKKVMRNKAYWKKMAKFQAESERAVRERLEISNAKKEAKFQRYFNAIINEKKYTKDIDAMLEFHEQMEKRKKVARYQDWNDNVYGKIQSKIQSNLTEKDCKKANRRRREAYENFLQTTNKKSSLFLDIIIESDYDPFVVNKNSIRCKTGKLNDPTKRVLVKHQEEKDILPGASKKTSTKAVSRQTLGVQMWASGTIESTPHGYFAKLMQERDPSTETKAVYKTNFEIDHFTYPEGREVIDAEFPKGKRTDFPYLDHCKTRKTALG